MAKYIANPVVVEADEIVHLGLVNNSGVRLACLEGVADPIQLTAEMCGGHDPKVGDYFIRLSATDQYICPKDVFERKYAQLPRTSQLNFGDALTLLKSGWKVCRPGWNGKAMWLAMSPGSKALPADKFWAGPNREYAKANGGTADVLPCITMKVATGEILMGWLASQTDMLAEDWMIVE
jgi:hypothetical protein